MSDNRENAVEETKSHKINHVIKELGIDNYEIIGNPEMEFSGPSAISEGKKDSITFCYKGGIKDPIGAIKESGASVVITEKGLAHSDIETKNKTLVLVQNPRDLFIQILYKCFPPELKRAEIHPTATIHPQANIHHSVYVGANCVLEKCQIEANSVIYANTVINDRVKIGKNVVINPGCVIGFHGYGYNRNEKNELERFPQYRGVVIEDDVELGQNVTVNRGTLVDTVIKKGAKIGIACHIAHNVVIGEHSAVVAQVVVCGSTKIGAYSWISPNAVITDRISVGSRVVVGLGAVVVKDVPDNAMVLGNPAVPIKEFKESRNMLKEFKKLWKKGRFPR